PEVTAGGEAQTWWLWPPGLCPMPEHLLDLLAMKPPCSGAKRITGLQAEEIPMLIKVRQGWQIPERLVTPEQWVINRRHVLRGAGALTIAGALAGCDRGTEAQNSSPNVADQASSTPDPTASLYPFKRNP